MFYARVRLILFLDLLVDLLGRDHILDLLSIKLGPVLTIAVTGSSLTKLT